MASNVHDDGSKCPICMETYKKPKALACMHTFCELCIHEYIMKSKERQTTSKGVDCPLCREITPIKDHCNNPEKWASFLKPNFALEAMLTAVTAIENQDPDALSTSSATDSKYSCQPCLEQQKHVGAKVFCLECQEYQCLSCKGIHERFGSMKEHEFVNITEQDEFPLTVSIRQFERCQKHNKPIQKYCRHDNKLCCSTCILEDHQICLVTDVKTEVSPFSFKQIIKSYNELLVKVKSCATFWSTENGSVVELADTLKNEISMKRKKVLRLFDCLERDIETYAEKVKREKSKESNRNISALYKLEHELNENIKLAEHVIKTAASSAEQFIPSIALNNNLSKLNKNASLEFSKLRQTRIECNYSTELEHLLLLESIGEPYNFTDKLNTAKVPDYRTAKLVVCELFLGSKAKVGKQMFIRGIDFLADGRLVAVDKNNKKLLIFPNPSSCRSSLQIMHIEYVLPVYPCSVACRGKKIIVTCGQEQKLVVFKPNKQNLELIKSFELKYKCDSISVIDSRSLFIGYYDCLKPLGVITDEGRELEVDVDIPGFCNFTEENMKCAYNSESGLLGVSNKNRDMIHIIDTKRDSIVNVRDGRIVHPRGLAFGNYDTLFVCSAGTNSLVQVNTDGMVLLSYQLAVSPYNVCISKDRKMIAVTSLNSNQIQCFRLSWN